MNPLTLVIGNKNYSSWSLRPWLLLRQAGIAFEEVLIPLYRPAPVVLRSQTYGVALTGAAQGYAEAVLALPALQAWVADAVAETERIEKLERDA